MSEETDRRTLARRRFEDNMSARAQIDLAPSNLDPEIVDLILRAQGKFDEVQGRKGYIRFTDDKKLEFLVLLAQKGLIGKCAHAVGVSKQSITKHRKEDPAFGAAVEEALEIYRDRIREAVHNRAIEGWEEPVFYQGELVAHVRKFSDRLMELHAKARVPEYREQVDVNVSGGVLVVGAALSPEEWTERYGGRSRAEDEEKSRLSRS